MGTRTSYEPGTFSWVDLQTSDVAAAKDFYAKLLGWTYDEFPMGDGPFYSMAKVGGESVCALAGLHGEMKPHWNNYVTVASVDESAARVRELGGEVVQEPFDVFTAGRMLLLRDPTGGLLCLWEPRDNIGAGRVNDVGCLTWNELATGDPSRAAEFYGRLLGWTYEENDMGGPEPYRSIKVGDRLNGGIRPRSEDSAGPAASWLPYFTTADADAAAAMAEAEGGRILMPPTTVPSPAQPRFAVLADPQGAPFAVFSGETDD